jgi:hypothetical protein
MGWKVPNRTGRSARLPGLSGAVLVVPDGGSGGDNDGEVGGGGESESEGKGVGVRRRM